jgi:hypothetical protein
MKNTLTRIASICIILLLCSYTSKANHIFGGDISWSFVNGSTYLVTVQVYQDCNATKDPANNIFISSENGVISGNVQLSSKICCAKDITPVSPGSCDRCSNSKCSFGFGIRKWIISAEVDLSTISSSAFWEFTFSYTDCCDKYINNFYIESKMNASHGNQSGPVYKSDPVSIICVYNIIDRFQDASPGNKNDSMNYYFTDPLSAPGTTIALSAPYTSKNPLVYTGNDPDATFKPPLGAGFHYSPVTGELQFRPTGVQNSYFALEADEYKKDSSGKYYLSGTTMRRAAISVIDCNQSGTPYIQWINRGTKDSVYVCANIPLSLSFLAFIGSQVDTARFTNEHETNGTFTYGFQKYYATETFNWTPTIKDVGKTPHILTITATNNGKTLQTFAQKKVYIFVNDSFPVTGLSNIDSGCGKFHINLTKPIDKTYKMSYQWLADSVPVSTQKDLSFHTTQAGRHIISLILSKSGGCTKIYSDTIWYDSAYHKLTPVLGFCKGVSIQLTAINQKNLVWSPGKGLSDSIIYNPVATPLSTTTYTVTGKDKNSCVFTDQTKINVSDYKIKTQGDLHICAGYYTKIYASSISGAKNTWTSSPGGPISSAKDTLFVAPIQNTTYHITVNNLGCIKKDSFTLFVPDSVNIGHIKKVCYGDSVPLHAGAGKFYAWLNLDNNYNIGTNADYTLPMATDTSKGYHLQVQVSDSFNGCVRTGNITIKVVKFNPTLSIHHAEICPGDSVQFTAGGGNKYQWFQNGNLISTQKTLRAVPSSSTKYDVNIIDAVNGCLHKDAVVVYRSPVSSRLTTLPVYFGDYAYLPSKGGSSYLWSPATGLSSTTEANPQVIPLVTTTYTVTITDSATGCIHTDTLEVFVDHEGVWPGDANKDKTADYLDVLNIGLAYGATGPPRHPIKTNWHLYPDVDWGQSTAAGVNFKHIDCNGDGVIDANDTAVISANYGMKYLKWTPYTGNPADPHIYFKFVKDTFYAGETATAYLYAGDAKHPLKNAYGIGFQAQHVAAPMVANSAQYFAACDYFCTGSELNYFRQDYANNSTDATVVETNRKPSHNTIGRFAGISFRLKDSGSFAYPPNGEKIYANLMSATVIDSTGKEINVYGVSGSAIVLRKKDRSGIEPGRALLNDLHIYPNPANNQLIIESENIPLKKITVYNAVGQSILEIDNISGTKTIDVAVLQPGIYIIEMKTEDEIARQKLLIQR